MNKNFINRKMDLAKSRKSITEYEWYSYLENNYPEWWKSIYGNKWPVTIIYYGRNDGHADEYPLYVDKTSTMYDIMSKFYKFLTFQKTAIAMCFGRDVSGNIIQHLPETNFDIENNYIYIHKRIFNIDNSVDFKRYPVPNNKSLMHLCGELCSQDTTNINLRIRKNPKQLKNHDFQKVFCY